MTSLTCAHPGASPVHMWRCSLPAADLSNPSPLRLTPTRPSGSGIYPMYMKEGPIARGYFTISRAF